MFGSADMSYEVPHMGSIIHLAVGRLAIDWGKNLGFRDHSALFQADGVTKIPYYYVNEDGDDIVGDNDQHRKIVSVYKDSLSKPLTKVVDRIDLLGYTLKYSEREFRPLSILNGVIFSNSNSIGWLTSLRRLMSRQWTLIMVMEMKILARS
jgi:hypothetical protein